MTCTSATRPLAPAPSNAAAARTALAGAKPPAPPPGAPPANRGGGRDALCWYEPPRPARPCTCCGQPSSPSWDGYASDQDGSCYFCNRCARAEGICPDPLQGETTMTASTSSA